MADETNSLSELAFMLDAAHMEMIASEIQKRYCNYVEAAKCIVNELAKVPYIEVKEKGFKSYLFPSRVRSAEAVNMCRAIARQIMENGNKKRQSTKIKKIDDDERIARDMRELVEKSMETIKALNMVMRHESCPILSHSLAEVKHDLAWCEKTFAE